MEHRGRCVQTIEEKIWRYILIMLAFVLNATRIVKGTIAHKA